MTTDPKALVQTLCDFCDVLPVDAQSYSDYKNQRRCNRWLCVLACVPLAPCSAPLSECLMVAPPSAGFSR